MALHTRRKTAYILLGGFTAAFLALGIAALREHPDPVGHFIDLLLHDRVMQIVMADFAGMFAWVFCWMLDDARKRGKKPWGWLVVGAIGATWMIALYLVRRPADGRTVSPADR